MPNKKIPELLKFGFFNVLFLRSLCILNEIFKKVPVLALKSL